MEERKVLEPKKSTASWGLGSLPKSGSVAGVDQEKSVQFFLKAPQARTVAVVGTFNQWDIRSPKYILAKDSQGSWSTSIRLKPGRYEYRFFVDGNWVDDPRATKTAQNKFGTKNAILEVK